MHISKTWPFAAIILTVIMWGFSFISIKIAVEVIPPMTLAFIRFLMASMILLIVLKYKEPEMKLRKKDFPLMVFAGVMGVTVYFYFENNGVKLITASAASIIISTIPIFTMIADAIVYHNPLTKRKIISVFLSVVGVYFVVGGTLSGLKFEGSAMGYFMMMGAALSWVIYSIVTKPLFNKYSQLAIVTYQSIFGTIALFPFIFIENIDWEFVTSTVIINILYLGIFCSALAYYYYVYAMDHLGIDVSSLFLNLIPIVTVTASFFILKEQISINQIIGGMTVIIAVFLATYKPAEKEVLNETMKKTRKIKISKI